LVLVAATGGLVAVSMGLQTILPLSLDIVVWILVLTVSYVVSLMCGNDALAARIFRKGMALLHRGAVMRAMFDDSFDGIVIADESGRIEHANPSATRLLGQSLETLTGKPVLELFRDGRQMPDRSAPVIEAELSRGDGSAIAVELVIRQSPLRRSRHRLERRSQTREISVWTFRDITERKRAADAQKSALQRAVAADRAKSEFIANMGHELRTPLNAIIGFSEMLKSQVLGPIGKADYIAYAAGINASGLRLLDSVNSILDFACIEGSRYELEEAQVALADLTANAIGLATSAARQKGIEIENRCPPIALRADPRAVRQILANLLSNAVKFTGNDGRVMIAGQIDAGGDCLLTVRDNGIGMAKDQSEKVLRPFQQAHEGLARKYEGVGLGLSVAVGLMQLHGGALEIDSADGTGTTVTLRFPAARVLNGQAAPVPERPANDPESAAPTATIHRLTPRTVSIRS
jgi:PAS domain S-box-containing protein